jgi:hypothetical protein
MIAEGNGRGCETGARHQSLHMRDPEVGNDEGVPLDDESCAPESGQTPGGREDRWADDEGPAGHAFPSSSRESPKDEL